MGQGNSDIIYFLEKHEREINLLHI